MRQLGPRPDLEAHGLHVVGLEQGQRLEVLDVLAEEDGDGGKVNRPYVGIVVSYDPTEGMDVQFGADDALYTITNEDDWHWGDNITNKVPMM